LRRHVTSQLKLSNCPAFAPIVGSAARLVFGVVDADIDWLINQLIYTPEQEDGSRFQT
jgi:hypothetical protein